MCSQTLFGIHHRKFPFPIAGNLSYSFFWWWCNTQLNNRDKRYYEAFLNLSESSVTDEVSMCFAVCSRIIPSEIREIIRCTFKTKLRDMSYSFPPFFIYALEIVDVDDIPTLSALSRVDDYVYAWMMRRQYDTNGDTSSLHSRSWDRRGPLIYVLDRYDWSDDVVGTLRTMIGELSKSTSYIERKMIRNVKPIK
jgi:hypothetical protein